MSVAANAGPADGGALERGGATSGLADVVETVLDKGVVIDAQVTVGVVGIPLVEINARVVVSSIETYLKFAEMTDRLDLSADAEGGLAGLVGEVTGAAREVTAGLGDTVGGATRQVGGTARELGRTTGDVVDDATGAVRDRPRRRER
ncbi:gas vesicle protein [Micromonospora endolithica]|uniref:Gas vesicle protein n=1 Tax=Micromonospora endolithica TaxID=230091 RepID=A0A3A9YSD7_9ACTN|nr:gas vesicle protein GvpJ [Micromonospora endolithica]RKN38910.1 gas vesicle protein [Micromonospora endolithica]TWJ25540.1 gas vesicle protein GvpA/GvpJ/GvpM family [Micromonospora endolithica]